MFNKKNEVNNAKSFEEKNISEVLYEFYFKIAKISKNRYSSKDKLDIIYETLTYINKNIDSFTIDELKLSANILKVSKDHIDIISKYKSLVLPNLYYCDNLIRVIEEKIKEPKV